MVVETIMNTTYNRGGKWVSLLNNITQRKMTFHLLTDKK
uniref:Uncharacterized protein n=1 Tax=Lepeophtheirus salmonis TaxID=72036 RepID=A0A0K2UUX1_LEPSM